MGTPCQKEKEIAEVTSTIKLHTALLDDIKWIKKSAVTGAAFIFIQCLTVVWYMAGDHFNLQQIASNQKEMEPKVAKLWFMHEPVNSTKP